MIKDADKQTDEVIHRARTGRVQMVELGVSPSGFGLPAWKFLESHTIGILRNFPAPPWRMKGGAENSKLLIMA